MEDQRGRHPKPGAAREAAPWHVVPAEFKWFARVAMARTVVKGLGKGVALGPPALDPEVVKAAAEHLGHNELAALSLAMPVQTIR